MITNLTFTNRFSKTALISLGLAVASLAFAPGQAKADSITFDASPNTGDPANVTITLDDTTNPGKITAIVKVNPAVTGNTADITGVFFDVPAGVGTLSIAGVSGGPVTNVVQGGGVLNLGGGVSMQGGGQTPFSVGVKIGASGGMSAGGVADDFQTTTFTIAGDGLSLNSFTSQSFGIRVQSVGPEDSSRNGSSKLGATSPSTIVASTPPAETPVAETPVAENPETPVAENPGTPETPPAGGGSDPVEVPEPMTIGGLLMGAGGLMAARRRKVNKNG